MTEQEIQEFKATITPEDLEESEILRDFWEEFQ
jgi:hypothetical protein